MRRYYADQRVLLELFGLELVPNLVRLFLAIPRSSLHLYRLLRQDEEVGLVFARPLRPLTVVRYNKQKEHATVVAPFLSGFSRGIEVV
jgi:hypothetical protein